MAEPFSAVPTSFNVRSGARVWWGNCIWDALAILALVGTDGAVSTACPHSGQPLRVSVTARGLGESQGIVHVAVPARCEQRHITPGAVFDLARLWRLAGTWRRRTIPERQAMLDAVGLTGSFWRLT